MQRPVRRWLLLVGVAAVAIAVSAVVFRTRGHGTTNLALPTKVLKGWATGADDWVPPVPVGVPDGGCPPPVAGLPEAADGGGPMRFVAIGDYGYAGSAEQ